ncbi:hypothetical protein PV327_002744 [Microctonus hyperodae]|uniref:Pseudouridylate synthase RPUSD4, mitochondrial n=1 Tax=Microctonus hyperodae TaxID=165561 RepID=A0AA39FG67_MICHY|nr:hypothetical protein PV327_002744 [Microctonus hyperodae]
MIGNRIIFRCLLFNIRLNHTNGQAKYPKSKKNIMDKTAALHPYRKIHPWKSLTDFTDNILEQIIYNKDGLVAINKPYGISARPQDPNVIRKKNLPSGIVDEKNYTITDTLPSIATKLGYDSLQIVKTPERFTTGVLLLSANDKITKAVDKSMKRAEGARIIPRTYWTVTRRVPIYHNGERRVAMKPVTSLGSTSSQPHIVSNWSKNERERGDIKILNVQFKVLCAATQNLASLLEIKLSTSRWHAVRLFAATVLLSPILGDRVYGSRAQDVMGKFINISPFTDAAHVPPVLDKDLLEHLKLTPAKTLMIPAHVHLREMFLPWFQKKGNDITITAAPQPEFLWTCQQLQMNEEILESFNNYSENSHVINSNIELPKVTQCIAITQ